MSGIRLIEEANKTWDRRAIIQKSIGKILEVNK